MEIPKANKCSWLGYTSIFALIFGLIAGPLVFVWAKKPRGKQYCSDCRWPDNPPHQRADITPWTRGAGPFSLKYLASAQAGFRSDNPVGDGIRGFWRKDVAGLYTLPGRDGHPIAFIDRSGALADDRPTFDLSSLGPRAPYRGYWFRAISHEGEGKPDPDRFAFCQFPSEYPHHGRMTFIIDENHTMLKKDVGDGGGIEVYPADPQQQGWTRVD